MARTYIVERRRTIEQRCNVEVIARNKAEASYMVHSIEPEWTPHSDKTELGSVILKEGSGDE